ncbi:MAG: hypothetical protein NW205_10625 [Hyphomicrobiaceae bacterium]|nr:hypothetical protein [Hyphomicrobiaceae bacterium]
MITEQRRVAPVASRRFAHSVATMMFALTALSPGATSAAPSSASEAPILIRIFKEEALLEVWQQAGASYTLAAEHAICAWSGTLGPKLAEGDRQAPEGFYTLTPDQLHNSRRWPRSLDLGFPNAHDRSLARTGTYLLIHGGCSSSGCFAMTDAVMATLYDAVAAAFSAGTTHVPVHIFPFRPTEQNLDRHAAHAWLPFWRQLREGFDSFERTRLPPSVATCNGRYIVDDGDARSPPGPLSDCGFVDPELLTIASRQVIAAATRRGKGSAINRLAGAAVSPLPATGRLAAPKVTCNLGLASCRKHMALKHGALRSRALATGKAGRKARIAEAQRTKPAR